MLGGTAGASTYTGIGGVFGNVAGAIGALKLAMINGNVAMLVGEPGGFLGCAGTILKSYGSGWITTGPLGVVGKDSKQLALSGSRSSMQVGR